MNKPKSIEEWKEIIATARNSGLSDKDWCLENNVSINSFYYNVRRLRRNACEVPATTAKPVSAAQAVVPLEIIDDSCTVGDYLTSESYPAKPICINCKGLSVFISNHASQAVITAVIQALKDESC